MPIVDIQSWFGINLDRWMELQCGQQPGKRAARCHAFQKEWIECADGIGLTRATRECQLELEDLNECMHRQKTHERLFKIRQQRDKLIKEGTYTPPPCHKGQAEESP